MIGDFYWSPILLLCSFVFDSLDGLVARAIGEVFGGKLKNLSKVFHGIKTQIQKTEISDPILSNIDSTFDAGRYHSWVIDRENFPSQLLVTAVDEKGEIMAARHKTLQVFGVQFHPESIMTPDGKKNGYQLFESLMIKI